MNFKELINKLQDLPDKQKKIILWTIVVILAVGMGYFWVIGAINNLSKIGKSISSINLPSMNFPSTNILQTTTPSNGNVVAQTSPDQTAGWQTYTNKEYGFEFKYPIGYSVTVPGDSQYQQGGSQWTIASDKSRVVFVLNTIKTSDLNIDSNQIIGSVNVGGIEGKILQEQTASYDVCYDIYAEKGETTYVFTDCQNDKTIFNQIISTFKFTPVK